MKESKNTGVGSPAKNSPDTPYNFDKFIRQKLRAIKIQAFNQAYAERKDKTLSPAQYRHTLACKQREMEIKEANPLYLAIVNSTDLAGEPLLLEEYKKEKEAGKTWLRQNRERLETAVDGAVESTIEAAVRELEWSYRNAPQYMVRRKDWDRAGEDKALKKEDTQEFLHPGYMADGAGRFDDRDIASLVDFDGEQGLEDFVYMELLLGRHGEEGAFEGLMIPAPVEEDIREIIRDKDAVGRIVEEVNKAFGAEKIEGMLRENPWHAGMFEDAEEEQNEDCR